MGEQPKPQAEQSECERTINECACAIRHEEGQPGGKAQEHWLRAEQEYDDDSGSAPPPDGLFGDARWKGTAQP